MEVSGEWGGPSDGLALVRTTMRGLALPGHVLRQPAEPVDFDRTSAEKRALLARHLFDAMYRGRGIGLAAPMVGISARVVVATDGDTSWAMFNPEVLEEGPERFVAPEGNLCLPDIAAEVERPSSISLRWRAVDGSWHEGSFEGLTARTLFHELELLDGQIFTDRVDNGKTVTSSAGQRAAAATSHVFGKPEKRAEKGDQPGLASCLTLPPSLLDVEASVLRRPAQPVDLAAFKRSELRKLIEAMFRQQYEQRGVGLAAPQIGLSLRLAVIDFAGGEPLVLINPERLEESEETESANEGCLSVPGWSGPVSRSTRIVIRNHTIAGKEYELSAEGYLARIIQHETDHLDGVLYADRVDADERLERNDHRAMAELALAAAQNGVDEPYSAPAL
jgi:peptide deformylase